MNKLIARRLLSVEEAAKYLGISPRTIYNQIGPKAKKAFRLKLKEWVNWSSSISRILTITWIQFNF